MAGFIELILALVVFLGSHGVAGAFGLRAKLVGALGERPYLILYSLVSLALLVWLFSAALRAPYVEVWPPVPGAAHLLLTLMPIACVLWASALVEPNPFSLGVRQSGFDPARPGMVAPVRHPLFFGMVLWAGGHLLANGDLAGILLFAPMLLLSLFGPKIARRKAEARLGGPEAYAALEAEMKEAPLFRRFPGWKVYVAAAVLYAVLISLHGPVVGIYPKQMLG
ncbi:MAG: NnrU family protein [Rhodospirillaceae bacterium]